MSPSVSNPDNNPSTQPDMTPETTQESVVNTELSELQAKLEAAESALKQSKDLHLRALAETDNARRRARVDIENAHKYSSEKFARELLQVIDSLEKSLEHINDQINTPVDQENQAQAFLDGIQLTYKLLINTFEKFGIKQINPPVGEIFNPKYHEALSMQPTDQQAPNTVLTVLQTGFSYHERVLRPARVVIATA